MKNKHVLEDGRIEFDKEIISPAEGQNMTRTQRDVVKSLENVQTKIGSIEEKMTDFNTGVYVEDIAKEKGIQQVGELVEIGGLVKNYQDLFETGPNKISMSNGRREYLISKFIDFYSEWKGEFGKDTGKRVYQIMKNYRNYLSANPEINKYYDNQTGVVTSVLNKFKDVVPNEITKILEKRANGLIDDVVWEKMKNGAYSKYLNVWKVVDNILGTKTTEKNLEPSILNKYSKEYSQHLEDRFGVILGGADMQVNKFINKYYGKDVVSSLEKLDKEKIYNGTEDTKMANDEYHLVFRKVLLDCNINPQIADVNKRSDVLMSMMSRSMFEMANNLKKDKISNELYGKQMGELKSFFREMLMLNGYNKSQATSAVEMRFEMMSDYYRTSGSDKYLIFYKMESNVKVPK